MFPEKMDEQVDEQVSSYELEYSPSKTEIHSVQKQTGMEQIHEVSQPFSLYERSRFRPQSFPEKRTLKPKRLIILKPIKFCHLEKEENLENTQSN